MRRGSFRGSVTCCSDVSGAFDKVSAERLLGKLRAKGVPPALVGVVASWLGRRAAVVIVDGASSREMVLSDMVFQGTLWGANL